MLDIPCLHRLSPVGNENFAPIQRSLGLAPSVDAITAKLRELNQKIQKGGGNKRSHFVTFDDGWTDVLLLEQSFKEFHYLQPILFLTNQQLLGKQELLPLHRLYEYCCQVDCTLEDMLQFGVERSELKKMSEIEQHKLLDGVGISRYPHHQEILSLEQIRYLEKEGWLIASHGGDHHNMLYTDSTLLQKELLRSFHIIKKFSGLLWFAWPEGSCDERLYQIAERVGFTKQFTLKSETTPEIRDKVICRKIWR